MALVTMASTEEAIDALVVRVILFFPWIVYNDLQLAVKLPLDVHLKVRHVLTHFLYFQQKMHNYKITESNHLRVSFAKTRTSS